MNYILNLVPGLGAVLAQLPEDSSLHWFMTEFQASYNRSLEKKQVAVEAGVQPEYVYASRDFMFWANCFYLFMIVFLYVFMKNREKFEFKKILLVYNASCVFLAGYVLVGILLVKLEIPGKFVGNFVDPTNPKHHRLGHYFYWFYLQKFWEFCDTWFFLLRKSYRQVSFLHIFHHCSINLVVGGLIDYDFAGDMFFPIVANAFIHVLMYSHYLVSALGFKSWWKSYLTKMQLTQFCLIFLQCGISLSKGNSYGNEMWMNVIMMIYMCSMVALFGNFFYQTYVVKAPRVAKGDKGVASAKGFDVEIGTRVYNMKDKNGWNFYYSVDGGDPVQFDPAVNASVSSKKKKVTITLPGVQQASTWKVEATVWPKKNKVKKM